MSAPRTTSVAGLAFEPPTGFRPEVTTVTLRVPEGSGFSEPPLAAPVRPTLVVERRPAPAAGLVECVAHAEAELARAIPGLTGFDAVDVRFADGAVGVVIAYAFPAPRVADVVLCQLQALRLDAGKLTCLTLTTTRSGLTETRRDQYVRILASAHLAGDPPKD